MYTFELNNKFLSKEEMAAFKKCLDFYQVDESIWEVFACLFRSEVKGTKPLVIRAYEDSKLCGAAIVARCRKYGRAMFKNKLMAGILNFIGIPVYLWMKFGFGVEFICNQGLAWNRKRLMKFIRLWSNFLKRRVFLL